MRRYEGGDVDRIYIHVGISDSVLDLRLVNGSTSSIVESTDQGTNTGGRTNR